MRRLVALIFCSLLLSLNAFAQKNLSSEFKNMLEQKKDLTISEVAALQQYDIYFIPGILAESLIRGDDRSVLDLSIITRDYFGAQLDFLNNKYHIPARRLLTSSHRVEETQNNIRNAVYQSNLSGRKVIFISHSLGGLALLEELITNPAIQDSVAGIAFLQSPFYGTPLGDILMDPPYQLEKIIKPLLPLVNISPETVEFVASQSRLRFMREHRQAVRSLIARIPLFTFSGTAEANKSIFKPLIDIMAHGCVKGIKLGCITEVFYPGPYDLSDGLIPLKSSKLENADYVYLKDVDHAEFILNVPFRDFEKEHLTTSWLRVLLQKIH